MTTEQTEQAAKQQYFELRTLLNQANPQKDLMTELVFELREDKDEIFIIIRLSSVDQSEASCKLASWLARLWVIEFKY